MLIVKKYHHILKSVDYQEDQSMQTLKWLANTYFKKKDAIPYLVACRHSVRYDGKHNWCKGRDVECKQFNRKKEDRFSAGIPNPSRTRRDNSTIT